MPITPTPSAFARELAYLAGLAADGRLADYLAAWGETGERDVACACVLANHLWRRLGVDVEISFRRSGSPDRLEVLGGDGSLLATVPPPLATFVRRFDAGEFPALVSEALHDQPDPHPLSVRPDGRPDHAPEG